MPLSKLQASSLLIFVLLFQPAFAQNIPYCQKGKWGFAARNGKITIPCLYESVDFFSDDNLAKVKKSGKFGYINKAGATVVPFEYDDCFRVYDVYHGEHSVGIKYNPEIHLNRDFDFEDARNNRYIVAKSNKYGVISLLDGKRKMLIPLSYSKIQFDPNTKTFHCSNNTTTQFFDTNGQKLTQEQVNSIERVEYSGIADFGGDGNWPSVTAVNGKVGVILKKTMSWSRVVYDTLVPIVYDEVITDQFDKDYIPGYDVFGVRVGDQWGIVDDKKNVLLPIAYDSVNFTLSKEFRHWAPFKRTFVAKKNDHWGILGMKDVKIDSLTTLLPFEYDGMRKIYYSYLLVERENKIQIFSMDTYTLISDKKYASVAKYEYETVNDFTLFLVTNKSGQTVYLGENGVEFFID
jgi:hypothetical protein